VRMPFGKHKGRELRDLPNDYLAWLADRELREPLRSEVEAERARRCYTQETAEQYDRAVAARIVATGYRQLSKQLHPDAGGSHADMLALNAARQYLEGRLL